MEHLFLNKHLSLLAKEKGFDEPCFAYYIPTKHKGLCFQEYGGEAFNMNATKTNDGHECVSAPLYQEIVDWFDSKGIFINIWASVYSNPLWWDWSIGCADEMGTRYSEEEESYTTKKEALNKAIEEAFKLI